MAKMLKKTQRNFQKTRFYDSCMLLVLMRMINYLFLFYFLSINIKYKLIVRYPFALLLSLSFGRNWTNTSCRFLIIIQAFLVQSITPNNMKIRIKKEPP